MLWAGRRTTMQPQLVVEQIELPLDVFGTGAVLPRTEVQQHVDLQTWVGRAEGRRGGREGGREGGKNLD